MSQLFDDVYQGKIDNIKNYSKDELNLVQDNRHALLIALSVKRFSMMEQLVKCGINVDLTIDRGFTTLMLCDNKYYTQLLIESGANVNFQNDDGNTAAHLSLRENQVHSLNLLINAGCDLNIKNKEGLSVLDFAYRTHCIDAAKKLFNLEQVIHSESTLDMAIRSRHYSSIQKLVRKHINFNTEQFTSLLKTREPNTKVMPTIKVMIKYGAQVDEVNWGEINNPERIALVKAIYETEKSLKEKRKLNQIISKKEHRSEIKKQIKL